MPTLFHALNFMLLCADFPVTVVSVSVSVPVSLREFYSKVLPVRRELFPATVLYNTEAMSISNGAF